jgi:hypothetical protein
LQADDSNVLGHLYLLGGVIHGAYSLLPHEHFRLKP